MIPNIKKMDTYWEGIVNLKEWSKSFDNSETIELNIGGESYVDTITDIHENGYSYIIDNQKNILDILVSAIYNYYCEIWDEFDLSEYFERITAQENIIQTIKPHRIYILNIEKDGIPYIGYEFYCDWVVEHGIGVMLHKDRVVDIGFADTAFTSWIAEEDAER